MEWSDHLDEMAEELDRLERQSSADKINVTTRVNETHVNLTYEHEMGEDNE